MEFGGAVMTRAQEQAVISGSMQEYRNGERRGWSVYFRATDAGRSESQRPRQRNDCTVRALALAKGISYDDAYDLLATGGRKCARGFHFGAWAKSQPDLKWRAFPAVKGETRMNPAKFCEQYSTGRWIIRTAKHVCAVVDGVVLDTDSPRPDRCIYGAWQVADAA